MSDNRDKQIMLYLTDEVFCVQPIENRGNIHVMLEYRIKLEDRSQKKKIMFLHSKNKASRKGYKGEC